MSVMSLKGVYYSVGEFPLLDHVDFEIQPKERIALIGRNGQGKSTLFKMLHGEISPEAGIIQKSPETKVAALSQSLPEASTETVYDVVASGLKDLQKLLSHYHALTSHPRDDEAWLDDLHRTQQAIEQQGAWHIQERIDKTLSALSLEPDALMKNLSGGWRRRVALAKALVQEPDVLLLDEPTNHLDLEAIQWLEQLLLNYPKTILFVTHDRALLRNIATQIIELDRGHLTSYPSDYDLYLKRKAKALEDEARHQALFDKKLSQEEAWIRQGIKARRTRNEGRVRALEKLREIRKQRRTFQKGPNFQAQSVEKKGKTVVQVEGVSFAYPNQGPIIEDFNLTLLRGDKLAIVGPNGVGKTTIVKLLMDQLPPTSGHIKHSPTNQIAFFDQTRAQINPEASLVENVAEGDDFIEIQGKKKHVISYLSDFLFEPKRCHKPSKTLSGGEQNRLMLAKLFSKPANVLILDEPTNDLDIESLEMLETLLLEYKGTVIIISHDREFIDNIATHTLVLEGKGQYSLDVGGYSDALERKKSKPKIKKDPVPKKTESTQKKTAKKLSYHEQRELEQLPEKIDELEKAIEQMHHQMAQPEFFNQGEEQIKSVNDKLNQLQKELDQAYERWSTLDAGGA